MQPAKLVIRDCGSGGYATNPTGSHCCASGGKDETVDVTFDATRSEATVDLA